MADVLTDRDIDDYVAAAGDVALLFVGTPEDVMLGALYQVRMLQSSTSARGGGRKTIPRSRNELARS